MGSSLFVFSCGPVSHLRPENSRFRGLCVVAVPSDVQKLPILAPKKNASISPYKPRPYHNTGPKNREPGKPGKTGNLGCRFSFIPGFGFPVFPASGGDFFHGFSPREKNQGTGNFREKPGNTGKSRHPPADRFFLRQREDKGAERQQKTPSARSRCDLHITYKRTPPTPRALPCPFHFFY